MNEEQTFDFEFGVPGVAVPPGIVDDSLIPPWLPLPFEMGVLNVVTDDCVMVLKTMRAFQTRPGQKCCLCACINVSKQQATENQIGRRQEIILD